jgi:hypothetical protein
MVRASAIMPEQVSDAYLQAQAREQGDNLRKRLLDQSAAQRPSLVVRLRAAARVRRCTRPWRSKAWGKSVAPRDVVLLSGVSGGGVSAAAFASRFDALSTSNPRDETTGHQPWHDYVETMGKPFIQDVLEGAGELRIAGSSSLGVLLEESLERRVFSPRPRRSTPSQSSRRPA